jgi:hypothetical protein
MNPHIQKLHAVTSPVLTRPRYVVTRLPEHRAPHEARWSPHRLANGGKITPAELTDAVRQHSLGTTASIAIRNTLSRLGLMHDGGDIQVAASATGATESKEYGAVASIMHKSGLHEKLINKGKISAKELDAALSEANIPTRDRLAVKAVMYRHDCISD